MHSITDIFNLILKSIFVGFGFIMPILALIRTSNLKALEVKDLFILTAVQAVRVSGIVYFILAAKDAYFVYSDGVSYEHTNVSAGAYWFYVFFSPLMYLVITQCFWIKKLYMKKPALITLSLLLLVLPSSFFMLFLKADTYMPLIKLMFSVGNLSAFLLNIIVFIFITFTIILLGGKLKDKKA